MNRSRSVVAALAVSLAALQAASAEPLIGGSRNSFGLPGLIDTPSALSLPDGVIGASTYFGAGGQRHSFAFQITPRLTALFRYSRIDDYFAPDDPLYDRSIDLHLRLLDEKGWRPAVAIGVRDFIGSGAFASEYVVATKTITPTLQVSAGIGWGRLGSSNSIGAPFGARPGPAVVDGSPINYDRWFRGDAAPFLGVSWQATEKLTLKAEYSPDAYAEEVARAGFDRASPLNLGLDYRIGRSASVSAYYLYGSEVGVQVNIAIDPRRPPFPSGIEKTPLPVAPRPSRAADPVGWSGEWAAEAQVHPAVQAAVAKALSADGILLESMALSASTAEVRVRNQTYATQAQALGHVARVLTRALPPSVEYLVLTSVANGMPTSSVTLRRSDLEAMENGNSAALLTRATITDALAVSSGPLRPTDDLFPRFQWALTPYAEASIFDPVDPFLIDVGIAASMRYEISPGLVLAGSVRQKVAGNLDQSSRVPGPSPVRSDLVSYQRNGDLTIPSLTLSWFGRPAENLYARVSFGLLERMFGGVSGELLWKPVDSRLALGAELNYVQKRDYEQRFGFLDYTVVTGHASVYYDIGSGFTGRLDVGRYLAGDWGGTVSLNREFANGWRIGAFATFTDMPGAGPGDARFDKGLSLTIPIGWTTGKPTIASFTNTFGMSGGDGGARLAVDGRLYDSVRQSHVGALYSGWGRFWR
ncbi:YjbH domain-containing protein [Phaeovulum sp.]|uniref:YjbH domain-containing protein n=1 Tax=Phaeovulum sp. TaxID=2934796 RepID=UPI0027316FDE|nr:YjbH domain-containing protein [Phaeovulum sp.]MDP1670017.1 YjbH domain-containing protein [Phaeovulum sp.]MDZ4119300.1 YjbH domain-containing protein [Phaeovulum sp.]